MPFAANFQPCVLMDHLMSSFLFPLNTGSGSGVAVAHSVAPSVTLMSILQLPRPQPGVDAAICFTCGGFASCFAEAAGALGASGGSGTTAAACGFGASAGFSVQGATAKQAAIADKSAPLINCHLPFF